MEHTLVIRAVIKGPDYNRQLIKGDVAKIAKQPVSATYAFLLWDEDAHCYVYAQVDEKIGIHWRDYPIISLVEAAKIDPNLIGMDWKTFTKGIRRSKISFINIDKKHTNQGGNPSLKIPKPASSFALCDPVLNPQKEEVKE